MTDKLGGDAGTKRDDDDQRALRELSDEIHALMDAHGVGGVLLLNSRKSAAWKFVIPKWAGIVREGPNEMRVRISSRTPALREVADATMGLVGSMRDMAEDVAVVFAMLWRQVEDRLGGPGAIEHRRMTILDKKGD